MSVEFEPVKLGPRRRRVDPVAIGALVVAIGLVAAIAKPWNVGAAADVTPAPSGPDSLSGPRSTAAVAVPRILTSDAAATPAWDEVRPVIHPHDAWGIRAIITEPTPDPIPGAKPSYVERWYPIPDEGNQADMPTVDIDPDNEMVVALGITFPSAHTPLDARIWRSIPNRLEWVDTQPIEPQPSGGGFLYLPQTEGPSAPTWGAGTYRIDVLVDGQIRRFGVTIPNRFSIVPNPSDFPRSPGELLDPAGRALPDMPEGLFANVRGVSVPLPAEEGPALDEAGAWLNLDPGTAHAPRSFVAAVFLPGATGLGVILPPGSVVQDSAVHGLAPGPLEANAVRVDGAGSAAGASAPNVLFRAPGGGAWPPGVYRISVAWSDAGGAHDRSWHVELRPGPVRELPPMLLAARGFARYAGASGVVVGTAEPLDGGPRSVAIRLLRPTPDDVTGFPARDQVRCDGVRVDGLAGIAGVAHPVDAPPSKVTARVLFEFSRSEEQPILTAADDVPGLILVAPAGDMALTSSVYRFRVGDDATVPGSTVCLWIAPVEPSAPAPPPRSP